VKKLETELSQLNEITRDSSAVRELKAAGTRFVQCSTKASGWIGDTRIDVRDVNINSGTTIIPHVESTITLHLPYPYDLWRQYIGMTTTRQNFAFETTLRVFEAFKRKVARAGYTFDDASSSGVMLGLVDIKDFREAFAKVKQELPQLETEFKQCADQLLTILQQHLN